MTTTKGISLSELLDSGGRKHPVPCIRAEMRAGLDFVAGIQEKARRNSDWNDIDGFAEAHSDMRDRLQAAFPKGPRQMLDLMSDGAGIFLDASIWHGSIEVTGAGGGIENLKRIIYPGNALNLNHIKIHDSVQGHGKGVRILLGTFKVAQRLDVEVMRLEADEIGSYVWARAGFLPDAGHWDKVRYESRRRLWHVRNVPPELKAKVNEILDRQHPAAIWALADLEDKVNGEKLAKHLLLGNRWMGHFKMNDAASVARLKTYAKSRKQ